ncbi:MAG: helix-turn-helix domain-containing protein, partial [Oscillospiraceae bacterium]|nr:helix-turn-helix domain-containing protein [Oscillospiraceae bacterium]
MRYWLREERLQRGLTQEEVAAQAGISRSYYVQIENESRGKNISPKTAMKLGKALHFAWCIFY